MKEDIEKHDQIVISGSLVDWGDELIPLFTLAIRLVTDTDVRIERLRKREKEEFGDRLLPGGDMYQNHQEFLEWAASYDTGDVNMRSKAKHDEWQNGLRHLVESGRLDKSVIRQACGRVLKVKFLLGLFENPYVDESRQERCIAARPENDGAKPYAKRNEEQCRGKTRLGTHGARRLVPVECGPHVEFSLIRSGFHAYLLSCHFVMQRVAR